MSIRAGKYHCKVLAPANGWFGEAGENNTPFIRLPLIVTDEGDAQGDETEWQGWLTDKSIERTCKTLAEVFGWDGDLEALAKQLNTGPFVGKACMIVCEEEEYKGKKVVKIKWLNRPDGGGKTMPLESAMTLARRLNARAKQAASEAEQPTPKKDGGDPDLDAPEDDLPY